MAIRAVFLVEGAFAVFLLILLLLFGRKKSKSSQVADLHRPRSVDRLRLDGHDGVAEADPPAADRGGVAVIEADRDPRLSPRGEMPLAGSKPTQSRPGTQASAQEWLVRPTCSPDRRCAGSR